MKRTLDPSTWSDSARQSWLWLAILYASSLAVAIVTFTDAETPLRPLIVGWFLFVCPGMALVRLMRLENRLAEWILAIALSLALDVIVAATMVYTNTWSPNLGLLVLIAISVSGAVLQLGTTPRLLSAAITAVYAAWQDLSLLLTANLLGWGNWLSRQKLLPAGLRPGALAPGGAVTAGKDLGWRLLAVSIAFLLLTVNLVGQAFSNTSAFSVESPSQPAVIVAASTHTPVPTLIDEISVIAENATLEVELSASPSPSSTPGSASGDPVDTASPTETGVSAGVETPTPTARVGGGPGPAQPTVTSSPTSLSTETPVETATPTAIVQAGTASSIPPATNGPTQPFHATATRTPLLLLTATRTQAAFPSATRTPVPTRTRRPTRTPNPSVTPIPTQTALPSATRTRRPTQTRVPSATPTPFPTQTAFPSATRTPVPTRTRRPTRTPQPSNTPIPFATQTSVPSATLTPFPTQTSVPSATPTPFPTQTSVSSATPTPFPTQTSVPSATLTPFPTATATPLLPTATNTPVPVPTATDTPVPPPSPTDTPVVLRSISGRVQSSGGDGSDFDGVSDDDDGEPGVSLYLSGGRTAVTNINGNYSFGDTAPGIYQLIPSKSGCNFSPSSRIIELGPSDSHGNNFNAHCDGDDDDDRSSRELQDFDYPVYTDRFPPK